MSLLDDFMESSEADLAPAIALFNDQFNISNGYGNGYDGVETMRVYETIKKKKKEYI